MRSVLVLALLTLLTAPSIHAQAIHAQVSAGPPSGSARVPGPIKYGGRYDVETGTWTRAESEVSRFGALETLYSNTATGGYFHTWASPGTAGFAEAIVDEGVIPASTDPTPFTFGGLRDASTVEEIQIGYCDFNAAGSGGWVLDFYDSYAPCTYPPNPANLALSVTLTGLPAGGSCWIIDVAVPASDFAHSGNGQHDGDPSQDSFGFEWRYNGAPAGFVDLAGFIFAGNPAATDTGWAPVGGAFVPPNTGSDTYYGEVGGCPGSGSGYGNQDFCYVENVDPVGPASGCYFFGGYQSVSGSCIVPDNLMTGHWLKISGVAPDPQVAISDPGCAGAASSTTGLPGELVVTGDADPLANDAALRATALPLNEFGIFATSLAPQAPLAVGNGFLCLSLSTQGGVGRFGAMNQIKNSGATGTMTLDTSAGEWDLAMIPTSVGTYAAVAGLTSHFQCWHRESGVGAGFNYTPSCSVTWQ